MTHTSAGYTGGSVPNPSYEAVCSGRTGHAEAVQVYYDGGTDFRKLLDCFFQHVDPTTLNRQGNDVGTQYRSVIYYFNDEQRVAAEQVNLVLMMTALLLFSANDYVRHHAHIPPPSLCLGCQGS